MRQIDRIYIQTLFAIIGSLLFFWSAALLAGQITVAWDATPDPAVGGYKLYYRQIGQNYSVVDVGYQTTFTLFGLENGKVFCIAAAAYNIARTFESGLSNEACKQLPPAFQDMNGDGTADLAGLSSAGQIFYTTNRSTWANIPGWLDQIRIKDINGDGRADIIGLSVGSIYYTTNLSIWTNIPGQLIVLDSNL